MRETGGRLSGHVALITGAGQGVGRGIALAMAKEGAAVGLAGRTLSKVEAVADEVRGLGGCALPIACEVTDRAQDDAAVAATVAEFGSLNLLINNAQSSVQRLLADTTDEDVELSWRSGPLASLYLMQAALPYLKERGGVIVNFGSSTAVNGDPTFGSYTMAKEALRGLTRVAAREWGRWNIRAVTVLPTAMSPAAVQWKARNPERFEANLKSMPLCRMGDPEADIGRAVAAICSDDMSYLSGTSISLNGGRVVIG